MNKTNIEEDIKIVNDFLVKMKSDFRTGLGYKEEIQAIENILADRERLEKENERLSNYRYENSYCIENTNLITKDKIASIQKNTYKIEIEDNVFVDIKELYVKANKYDSLIKEIENKIKEIGEYSDTARELIEEKIIIADSDSLNFGRQQAHNKDREVLRELLDKEKEKYNV